MAANLKIAGVEFVVEASGFDAADREAGIDMIRDALLDVADLGALTDADLFEISAKAETAIKAGWNFQNPAANEAGFFVARA